MKYMIISCLLVGLLPILGYSQSCDSVKISDFPAKDLPAASERASLQRLESYKYYFGIGVPVDYVKARKIAFIEAAKKTEMNSRYSGYAILLMIYANGFGVKRNLDLCIRLACGNVNEEHGYFGTESRIENLEEMKKDPSGEVFDVCDGSGGRAGGFMCFTVQAEKSAWVRDSTLNKIKLRWPASHIEALKKLQKAADLFFKQRSENEVDLSGTDFPIAPEGERIDLENDFVGKILKSEKCDYIEFPADSFSDADKELNVIYSRLMKGKDTLGHSEIDKEGIKDTQRSWIGYRDAWVRFIAICCPKTPANSIKTLLTKERTSQLEELVEIQADSE